MVDELRSSNQQVYRCKHGTTMKVGMVESDECEDCADELSRKYADWGRNDMASEIDRLTARVAELEGELACAKAFHDEMVAERNLAQYQRDRLRAALERIGDQAVEGSFVEHGECPATFACSAIIGELIDLGMPPRGVRPADETKEEP